MLKYRSMTSCGFISVFPLKHGEAVVFVPCDECVKPLSSEVGGGDEGHSLFQPESLGGENIRK